ncbi:MAG: hypothetical protein U1F50_01295 [Rubrivivax sp.]
MNTFGSAASLAGAVIALALTACGGGGDDPDKPAGLFDGDGRPSAAAMQRPGCLQASSSGPYATSDQYAWEELTAAPYTVLVDLDSSDSPAASLAKALADHRWAGPSPGVSHFVRGGSPEQAAAVADGLRSEGIPNVFLVVDCGTA